MNHIAVDPTRDFFNSLLAKARAASYQERVMGLFSKPMSIDDFATFAGAAMAQATPFLGRGETFAPLGLMRKSGLLGASNGGRQFSVGENGKIDLGASVKAALEWMEGAIPEGDAVGVLFDGLLASDEGKQDALIGRFASIKNQLMVEVALPYRKADDSGPFAVSDPEFRFNAIAADDAAEQKVYVDATAFDAAFRNGFGKRAPASV